MKKLLLFLSALLFCASSFAQVAAITGPGTICIGSTQTYTDATSGGVWSSSNPAVVALGSSSGVATGVAVGISTISYTVGGYFSYLYNYCDCNACAYYWLYNGMPRVHHYLLGYASGWHVGKQQPCCGHR